MSSCPYRAGTTKFIQRNFCPQLSAKLRSYTVTYTHAGNLGGENKVVHACTRREEVLKRFSYAVVNLQIQTCGWIIRAIKVQYDYVVVANEPYSL